MINLDAYNISFMLMDAWRKFAMQASGTGEKLINVPVYVTVNGECIRVTNVTTVDGKIILGTDQ